MLSASVEVEVGAAVLSSATLADVEDEPEGVGMTSASPTDSASVERAV